MAEHAYNNSVTSATGMTPFYANYWGNPEILNPQQTEMMNPAAHPYAHWIKGAFEKGKIALEAARKRMSENTVNRRIPPPANKIGDPVILTTRHIKTKKPSRKLDHKYLSPIQIDKVISPTAVRLILPQKWKTHPSFHVSELEPFVSGNRLVPDFTKVLREVSDIEADEEYDVYKAKGSITHRNRVLYHVKWLGYPKTKDWTFEL